MKLTTVLPLALAVLIGAHALPDDKVASSPQTTNAPGAPGPDVPAQNGTCIIYTTPTFSVSTALPTSIAATDSSISLVVASSTRGFTASAVPGLSARAVAAEPSISTITATVTAVGGTTTTVYPSGVAASQFPACGSSGSTPSGAGGASSTRPGASGAAPSASGGAGGSNTGGAELHRTNFGMAILVVFAGAAMML